MKKYLLAISCAALAMLCSCSGQKGWKVSGAVEHAQEGDKVALQGFNGASWYLIDSLALDNKGAFAYSAPQPAHHPDIYRIGYNGKAIYFPIDSVDALEIYANALNFDQGYGLAGTPAAVQMMEVDKRLGEAAAKGLAYVTTDSLFKRELNDIILRDSVGIIAYYLINKTIGNEPLYSINRRQDVKMLGAVANKFSTEYPDDPRTKFLVERFRTGRQATGLTGTGSVFEAQVLGLFELDLYDVNGVKRSLTETADNAGVTLLSFTSYNIENSVPYNVELNRLYELFRPQGLAIYQVALDEDEVQWMQAARNLPWIAVRQDPNYVGEDIARYNIATIPVTFVINGKGELVERVDDPTKLEAAIRKAL